MTQKQWHAEELAFDAKVIDFIETARMQQEAKLGGPLTGEALYWFEYWAYSQEATAWDDFYGPPVEPGP